MVTNEKLTTSPEFCQIESAYRKGFMHAYSAIIQHLNRIGWDKANIALFDKAYDVAFEMSKNLKLHNNNYIRDFLSRMETKVR